MAMAPAMPSALVCSALPMVIVQRNPAAELIVYLTLTLATTCINAAGFQHEFAVDLNGKPL